MTQRLATLYHVPAHSRLTNPIIASLLRLGLALPPMVLLTVRGRRTGQSRTTPVGLFEHEGHRYLFSTFGESNWVRNLRAAGEGIVTRRRQREAIIAVELTPERAGPILQGMLAPYLASPIFGRALRPRFPVAPGAPLGAFIEETRRHPLFEVHGDPGRVTDTIDVPLHVPSFVPRLNGVIASLIRLGIPMGPTILLTVRGRKTGQPRTTPVGLFERDGQRFLFATFGGNVNWVRNLRMAGEGVLTRGRRREAILAVELSPEEAAPVLKDVVAPFVNGPLGAMARKMTGPIFTVGKDASVEDFIAEARRHPVFAVRAQGRANLTSNSGGVR